MRPRPDAGMTTLLDNDIVLKGCAWQLVDEVILFGTEGNAACLGVARYSIRSRLRRWSVLTHPDRALACFEASALRIQWLEPTADEIALAADFEELALTGGFQLDSGESQLAAMAVTRNSRMLITGDKRAIVALSTVAAGRIDGRIACLEQLLTSLCMALGDETVQHAVCSEPRADRTAAIVFACTGSVAEPRKALASYVNHLRATAPMLAASDALPAVVAQEDGIRRA